MFLWLYIELAGRKPLIRNDDVALLQLSLYRVAKKVSHYQMIKKSC